LSAEGKEFFEFFQTSLPSALCHSNIIQAMNFLKKLFSKGGDAWKDETSEAVFIYSQCGKCHEKFRNRIDKTYDLVMSYDDNGPAYRVRKELLGSQCRTRVILHLEFDSQKRLISKSAENGTLITREEFETPAEKAPNNT
jgi:hypothetical protein